MTLIDTDVIIEIMKGENKLLATLSGFGQCGLSVISAMELVFGARNQQEVRRIERALSSLSLYCALLQMAKQLPVFILLSPATRATCHLGGQIRESAWLYH